MARKNTGSTQKTSSTFTTIDAAQRLMASMEVAINNMIEEIKKPVDQELKDLSTSGQLSAENDYSGGFAERYSK